MHIITDYARIASLYIAPGLLIALLAFAAFGEAIAPANTVTGTSNLKIIASVVARAPHHRYAELRTTPHHAHPNCAG
ncbi:MAG TPA: hypothetical protein VIG51_05450 [Candidatus Baltobacteraceae bacterium]|jgi:hypothetical protein